MILYWLSCVLTVFYLAALDQSSIDIIEFADQLSILARQSNRLQSPQPLVNFKGTCSINATIQLLEILWLDSEFRAVADHLAPKSSDQSLQAQMNRAVTKVLHQYNDLSTPQFGLAKSIESILELLCQVDPSRWTLNTGELKQLYAHLDLNFDIDEMLISKGGHLDLTWWYLTRSLLNGPVGLVNVSNEVGSDRGYQERSRVFGVSYPVESSRRLSPMLIENWLRTSGILEKRGISQFTRLELGLFFGAGGIISTAPSFLSYVQTRWHNLEQCYYFSPSHTFPLSLVMPNNSREAALYAWYDCCGFLCDGITAHGLGHVIAYVLRGDQWYLCNDICIEKVSLKKVTAGAKAGVFIEDGATMIPYVFLYRKRT